MSEMRIYNCVGVNLTVNKRSKRAIGGGGGVSNLHWLYLPQFVQNVMSVMTSGVEMGCLKLAESNQH